jgi:Carboxypeptidase regulatory-like domain
MRSVRLRVTALALGLMAFALIFSGISRAQDNSSMIGVVTDPSGALVPGTNVTLSNPSTGVSFTQKTDSLGSYRFANVPPGPGYKVTFSHAGFSTAQISDITLSVGIVRTQNVALKVGGESQTVAVSASNQNVTLDTTDATIGNNIDPEQLNDLPVYDRTRGISTLMYQQAGVDMSQGAVTGARIDQSEVTVDGLDVDDLATGQTFYLTSPAPVDSVQQFTGAVGGLTSGVGTGSGGQFQLVTKNGTNHFHGNLNEYHRDTTTVANTWFNNLTGIPRTPLIRNQFGGNLGGPIKRDKIFFFFNWAQSRIVQSATTERTVPLPASDGGLLAGTLNYINSSPGCGDSSRINNQPGCITTLTGSQIQGLDPAGIGLNSAEMAFIAKRYPAANDLSQGDGVNTGGFRFTYPTPNNNVNYIGRIDYNLTSTQKIFGKFNINRQDAVESLPEFPTDPSTHPFYDRSYSYVVNHTWQIGSNKVNAFYYGDQISKLSFPDIYNPLGANQPSFSGLDGPYTSFDGQKRRVPVPMVRDDFSWQKGRHSLTFGGTFKFIKTNSNLISDFNFPGIGLQGTAIGSGLEDSVRPTAGNGYVGTAQINNGPNQVAINDYDSLFATGLGVIGDIFTNYSYDNKGNALPAGAGTPRAYRFYQTEVYFGDTWKVNSKLTLDYGLRYQYYSVPFETRGFESVPSPIGLNTYIKDRVAQQNAGNTSNTGLPIYSIVLGGKANNGPNLYAPNYKDFAPRFGFAWSPYASGKTVINGSAGIVYDRTIIDAIDFLQDQISYLFFNQTDSQFGSGSGPAASLAADPRVGSDLSYNGNLNPAPQPITTPYVPYVDSSGQPFGLAAGETNFVISPNLKDPYSIALNFGIQQQLPANMILKVNYVGRLGRRLIADADAGQVIDVPDYTGGSTQTMAQAFAGLTTDLRAGKNYTQVTPQPWFEDVLAPIFGPGNNTSAVAYYTGQLARRGDISDALYYLAAYGYYYFGVNFLPTNIGIPSQFGSNTYLTNLGSSNYHGLLVTLDKNMSNGLRFEANYTWSHSIDNTSVSANNNALFTNSNMICDILYPRACRGSSDFDVRQEFNSNFEYALPFGRGRMFMANAPRWADEAFGGWSISGLPSYRTGLPLSASADAYLASFDNLDHAIFTGNKADLKASVNVNHASKTVYMFSGGASGAAKVLSEFRGPIGIEYGQRNIMRGPGAFFFDAGLGKQFPILENKLNLNFRADAFNLFNHPDFGTGGVDIVNNASQFGQITGTVNGVDGIGYRVAQFSLRLDF